MSSTHCVRFASQNVSIIVSALLILLFLKPVTLTRRPHSTGAASKWDIWRANSREGNRVGAAELARIHLFLQWRK